MCVLSCKRSIPGADNKAGTHKGQLNPVEKHNLRYPRPDTIIVTLHVCMGKENFTFIVDQLLHVHCKLSVCILPFKRIR